MKITIGAAREKLGLRLQRTRAMIVGSLRSKNARWPDALCLLAPVHPMLIMTQVGRRNTARVAHDRAGVLDACKFCLLPL
jgi:hypothetical protein